MYAKVGRAAGGKGFLNDVWISKSSLKEQDEWDLKEGSFTVESGMKWKEVNPGKSPPNTWPSSNDAITHDEWIQCQDYFVKNQENSQICKDPDPICYENATFPGCYPQATWKKDNMWSPRRGHGTVIANDNIFVIGGRANEVTKRKYYEVEVEGIPRSKLEENSYSREYHIRLKNDVWTSKDDEGKEWKLVTPGCGSHHQEDILLQTEVWSSNNHEKKRKIGSKDSYCTDSTDCYGVAECRAIDGISGNKVCVCPMFSAREHHSVTVQTRYFTDPNNEDQLYTEDYIYIFGGFTTVRKSFCADKSCGRSDGYRIALNDAWVSNDGLNWVQLRPYKPTLSSVDWKGRGAHASLLIPANNFQKLSDLDHLWISGGEVYNPNDEKIEYLNDIIKVELSKTPCCQLHGECNSNTTSPLLSSDVGNCLPQSQNWILDKQKPPWSGRSGHLAIYEAPTSANAFYQKIYIVGGMNSNDGVLSDVWHYSLKDGEEWKQDYSEPSNQWTNEEIKMNTTKADKELMLNYFSGAEKLDNLLRLYLPIPDSSNEMNFTVPHRTNMISKQAIETMNSIGIHTISDLAETGMYTVLKIKNQVPNVCYFMALAKSLLDKCKLQSDIDFFGGDRNRIVNFDNIHYKQNKALENEKNHDHTCVQGFCREHDWDGCSPIDDLKVVNVERIGDVIVPQILPDIAEDLEDLECRQIPSARSMASGIFLRDKIMIFGGKGALIGNSKYSPSTFYLYQDVWTRDDKIPQARISVKPRSHTSNSIFHFESDYPGAYLFEYKIIDRSERLHVTPWLLTTSEQGADVSWLDDKKQGPGKGTYILYLRAISPSGNKDIGFSTKDTPSPNVYQWHYKPPPNVPLILTISFAFLLFLCCAYYNYHQKQKRKALERFAKRRLKRQEKLNALERNGELHGWRTFYMQKKEEEALKQGGDGDEGSRATLHSKLYKKD